MLARHARCTLLLGLSLAWLGACSGASWQSVRVPQGYVPPREIKIAVVSRTNAYHVTEATEALATAVVSGLESEGIKATVVPAPTGAEPLVSVVEWNQGHRALRWLVHRRRNRVMFSRRSAPSASLLLLAITTAIPRRRASRPERLVGFGIDAISTAVH